MAIPKPNLPAPIIAHPISPRRLPATPVPGPPPAERFAAETTKKSRDRFPIPTRQDWETMSLDDAHALVQKLIAAYQEGANIFNQRSSNLARESGMYRCMVCNKRKSQTIDNHPNYVWREDRPDPITRIYESKYICSSECYFRGSNSGALTNAKVPGNVHK